MARMRRRLARFALVAVSTLRCATAFAQERGDIDEADRLFKDGKHAMGQGRVSEACALFAKSNELVPKRGGVVLNLGLCREREGKLLLAHAALQDALALARRDRRDDRVPLAAQHLQSVEAKLSWISVVPPSNVADTEVRIDGNRLERSAWDAVPLEGGRHVITASAIGFRPRETVVNVETRSGDGAGEVPRRLTVQIEPLEPVAKVAAPPFRHEQAAARKSDPAPRPSGSDSSSTLRIAALVTGIAGFAVSLAAGAWALERKGAVDGRCNSDKVCSPGGEDAATMGRALVITSTAAFAVGAIGIGGWLFLPKASEHVPAREAAAGFAVGGAF